MNTITTPILQNVKEGLSQTSAKEEQLSSFLCTHASYLAIFFQLLSDGIRFYQESFIQTIEMGPVIELAVASLNSYQQPLIAQASGFLEAIILMQSVDCVQAYGPAITVSCVRLSSESDSQLRYVMDHPARYLVYQTNSTPLSLLFVIYEHAKDWVLQVFPSFFEPISAKKDVVPLFALFDVERVPDFQRNLL